MFSLSKFLVVTLFDRCFGLFFESAGLAEAGLIPSNLSSMNTQSGESESGGVLFSPDRYV